MDSISTHSLKMMMPSRGKMMEWDCRALIAARHCRTPSSLISVLEPPVPAEPFEYPSIPLFPPCYDRRILLEHRSTTSLLVHQFGSLRSVRWLR